MRISLPLATALGAAMALAALLPHTVSAPTTHDAPEPAPDTVVSVTGDAANGFEIGYYDRVTRAIVRVPFRHVRFEKGEHFALEAVEDDGSVHTVPLHRVREVWRNGALIWVRRPKSARR